MLAILFAFVPAALLALDADAKTCAFSLADHSDVELMASGRWQEAAWLRLDHGDLKSFREIEERLAQKLRHGTMIAPLELIRSGSGESYLVRLSEGVTAVFKPDIFFWRQRRVRAWHKSGGPERSVAAWEADRAIRANVVPVTVLREIDGMRGSLQAFVHLESDPAVTSGVRTRARLELFQFIEHKWDSSPKNEGRALGGWVDFDAEMAFLPQPPHFSFGIAPPPRLEAFRGRREHMMAAKGLEIDTGRLRARLSPYLPPEQIEATVARAEAVRALAGD